MQCTFPGQVGQLTRCSWPTVALVSKCSSVGKSDCYKGEEQYVCTHKEGTLFFHRSGSQRNSQMQIYGVMKWRRGMWKEQVASHWESNLGSLVWAASALTTTLLTGVVSYLWVLVERHCFVQVFGAGKENMSVEVVAIGCVWVCMLTMLKSLQTLQNWW